MNIAIVGTGYVGLVTGTCFAEMGTNVTCVDIDTKKIDKLNNGIMPIYEPGLEELVKKNVREGRLHFTTDLTSVLGKVEIVFSAVGTPPDEDGSADLHYVLDVARTFGHKINRYTLLVTKSTVPVGTAQKVKAAIREELEKRGVNIPFDVASNPEFLKEGAAIKDFMNPDRVVVGVDSQQARTLMERLYKPFLLNGFPILFMDVSSAEMTKYAANATLATRISFMNDIANLCERIGANVDMVRKGMGADDRMVHPQVETYWGNVNPIGLRSCYDEGKRCAETLFMDYHRQNGVRIKIIRIFNTYGPRMNPNDGRVVSNFIVQALRGESITIYGDGTQTRSFQYVDDLIEAMIRMMATEDDFTGPVNTGNPDEFTMLELAERIIRLTGSKSEIVFNPLPSDDPKQRKPDISLATRRLGGWSPSVELERGLQKTIEYFKQKLGN